MRGDEAVDVDVANLSNTMGSAVKSVKVLNQRKVVVTDLSSH